MGVLGDESWWTLAAIVAGTLVSEDATCIATGLLIRAQHWSWPFGVLGCTLGIFAGDLGLWLLGRAIRSRATSWHWVRRRLPAARVAYWGRWLDRRGWMAVLGARFLPGSRFPVYVAAGILGRREDRFLPWALLAALLWTPPLVLVVAAFGESIVAPLHRTLGVGWLALVIALVVFLVGLRVLTICGTRDGRARMVALVSRVWRWEFWPAWLFYLPLVPWLGYLAVRYRGLTTPTAANPGMPHGGVVGESKFAILSQLPREWTAPSVLIAPGPVDLRVAQLLGTADQRGWAFPLILKPDAGQRGAGVKLVRDADAAVRYLAENPQPVLAQVYHAGPFEAGIFYYRMPNEARGRIFSITDKQFPVLVGDGVSSVKSLIRRHPRFRMQAGTFLARMNGQAETVPSAGARIPLAIAGNHCQGTLFRDGARLMTPELERTIDLVARSFDGFFFGRFDVRYGDAARFRAGADFTIVELNGVTSESTNVYDPTWSLASAYRVLFRQWAILFEIGNRNRRRGHRPSSLGAVIADARAYYRDRPATFLSD